MIWAFELAEVQIADGRYWLVYYGNGSRNVFGAMRFRDYWVLVYGETDVFEGTRSLDFTTVTRPLDKSIFEFLDTDAIIGLEILWAVTDGKAKQGDIVVLEGKNNEWTVTKVIRKR